MSWKRKIPTFVSGLARAAGIADLSEAEFDRLQLLDPDGWLDLPLAVEHRQALVLLCAARSKVTGQPMTIIDRYRPAPHEIEAVLRRSAAQGTRQRQHIDQALRLANEHVPLSIFGAASRQFLAGFEGVLGADYPAVADVLDKRYGVDEEPWLRHLSEHLDDPMGPDEVIAGDASATKQAQAVLWKLSDRRLRRIPTDALPEAIQDAVGRHGAPLLRLLLDCGRPTLEILFGSGVRLPKKLSTLRRLIETTALLVSVAEANGDVFAFHIQGGPLAVGGPDWTTLRLSPETLEGFSWELDTAYHEWRTLLAGEVAGPRKAWVDVYFAYEILRRIINGFSRHPGRVDAVDQLPRGPRAPRRPDRHVHADADVLDEETLAEAFVVGLESLGEAPYELLVAYVMLWATACRPRESLPGAEDWVPMGAGYSPQRADARQNVQAILDAAERCLARDPDATIADIASEAGLGRVTVYGHFKTRRELVEVVVRRALDAANDVLREVDLAGEPAAALARLVDATWRILVRSGTLLVAADKALPRAAVRDLHRGELESRVHRFIAASQQAGEFRTDLSTDWLVASFHAVVHLAANEIDAGRLDADEASSVITATMLAMYRAPIDPG